MAYRKCPNHGWLETAEYAVDPCGETVCPACELAVTGFYEDARTRMRFGNPGGPNHSPRPEWTDACMEYMRRTEDLSPSEAAEQRPVMAGYDFPPKIERARPDEVKA